VVGPSEVGLVVGPSEVGFVVGGHQSAVVGRQFSSSQLPAVGFRIRDSYDVEIEQGQDDIVILAISVCIDQIAH
jgi:uncharacterized protein YxjI